MAFKGKTDEVKEIIASKKTYPLVNFEINVDGSACLLVKYADRKYYEQCVPRAEMKMGSDALADLIIARVENYYNGWAVRKGLVVR